jgi:hypothetical protein
MERQYKPFDDYLEGFLVGSLLGDGFARKGTSKTNVNAVGTAFTFAQKSNQKEYIDNIRSLLLEYDLCTNRIPQIECINPKETNPNKLNYKYVLYSKKDEYFDFIYDAFYKYDIEKNKYIKCMNNKDYIYRYFTPLSLAV